MVSAKTQLAKTSHRVDSRVIARKALLRLLEPLAGFVLDSGLSVQELNGIFRQAAVRSVAAQQLEVSRRVNISGIAASTGISRAEISRILKSTSKTLDDQGARHRQSTNRVLTAWHQNPKYTNANGQPADLRLYGRGATFEGLVKTHGTGIPIRALLDELIRSGAIEIKSTQVVRLKSLFAIERGPTPQVMKAFGDHSTELLSTLLQNMRHPETSAFVASVSGTRIPHDAIPLVRKVLATRGANFLADIGELLARDPIRRSHSRSASRTSNVSITVFLHESGNKTKSDSEIPTRRRNFRRGK